VSDNGADPAAAAAAAKSADVAVVFAFKKMGEFTDPTTLSLDADGDALISAVAAANPNTVVILETGSAVTMPWLDQVRSVIEAWYPGDQQGTALARLLYGDVNFTGKLPMTFPKSLADIPTRTRSSTRASSPTARRPGLVRRRSGRSTTPRAWPSATSGTTARTSSRSSRSATDCSTRRTGTTASQSGRRAGPGTSSCG
jgi:hypothetical protein